MIFFIQTFNHKIEHDFSFHLRKAIDYQNWVHNDKNYMVIRYCDTPSNDNINFNIDLNESSFIVPIGSIEFVTRFLFLKYNFIVKPINIPEELLDFKFTKRNVFNGTNIDIENKFKLLNYNNDKLFIKSNDFIKLKINNEDFTGIYSTENKNNIPKKGNYQISDIIEIESEYRCFVYQKELIGLSNYIGDFTLFPNIDIINEMIKTYTSQPIAYTLDVGITNKSETVIIEVHDMFSVGLYGFANYNVLPYLFSKWLYGYINKHK